MSILFHLIFWPIFYITTASIPPKLFFPSPSRNFASFTPCTSSFSATARSLLCSVPRWSHRLHSASPLTPRPRISAVATMV
ncbi:hypothetical protein GLYMA_15G188751v4 [Glycine max]|nr:hypothetical protein GLYMA_15G188751v4 [Glycine max]